MNVVMLIGVLTRECSLRSLPSGGTAVSLELSVETTDGRVGVPVAWLDPPANPDWEVGTRVVVRGHVRRRFFRTVAGTQSRTEVVAAEVIAAPSSRQLAAVSERARRALAGERVVSRAGGARVRSATSA
jgi:single-stranded DNA-binding protein